MIQKFSYAKFLTRNLAKVHKLKNMDDWIAYTKTKDFETNFKNVLPKNPEVYYSKINVQKRLKKEALE